ncbi:MAG: pyridoxal 5'-phosphate synthase glutaminase subunit PdxT [Bacillota bacterium]
MAPSSSFKAHQEILAKCGVEAVLLHKPEELSYIDGLIISDTECPAFKNLQEKFNWQQAFLRKVDQGMPVFGISNGMIWLAKEDGENNQFSLGLMDIRVCPGSFGEYIEGFEARLTIDALGKAPFPGVFINAPFIEWVKPNVGILAEYDGKIVMVRQGNFLGAVFHPELTDDIRVHLYFKQMIEDAKD